MVSIDLYWGSGSPYAMRVQILLNLKGIKYNSHLIEFSKKEHKTEEFIKMNPRGKVPTLKITRDDGTSFCLYESRAILNYFETVYAEAEPKLLPTKDVENYEERLAKVLIAADEADYIEGAFKSIMKANKEDIKELSEAFEALDKELSRWEDQLKENGSYLQGSLSMADVAFYPWLALIVRYKYPLDKFPLIAKYAERMTQLDAVQAAYPPHWKDNPAPSLVVDLVEKVKNSQ